MNATITMNKGLPSKPILILLLLVTIVYSLMITFSDTDLSLGGNERFNNCQKNKGMRGIISDIKGNIFRICEDTNGDYLVQEVIKEGSSWISKKMYWVEDLTQLPIKNWIVETRFSELFRLVIP